jgi:radical SAM protein with 4Fe4S-binding SPASM domain
MINQPEFDRKVMGLSKAFHPVNASFEITNRCNASCGYCYIKHECLNEDLSLHNLQRIVDKLYEAGVFFLCITGGEPFIRPDIAPFLEYCVQKNFFKISILTNGTLLSDDHIALLSRNRDNFSYIKISIFSHIPEIHDAYCGIKDSFRTIIDNAMKIKRAGIDVFFSLNILDFNCETIELTKKYFEDMGFSIWDSFPKVISSNDLSQALQPMTTQPFYTRYLRGIPKENVEAYQEGLKEKMGDPNRESELCMGLYSTIHVSSSGDVLPCISFRKFKIGNILGEASLTSLLRESKEYNRLRSMKKTDIPACGQCSYLNFCQPCIGIIHSEFERFDRAPEQLCNFNKALHEMRYD